MPKEKKMKKKNKLEVQAFNMWPKQADSSIPFLKPRKTSPSSTFKYVTAASVVFGRPIFSWPSQAFKSHPDIPNDRILIGVLQLPAREVLSSHL